MDNIRTQTIDFVPDEVLHKRRAKAQYKGLFMFGIILLTMSVLASVGLYIYQLMLDKDSKSVDNEISIQLSEIEQMKNIAESGYTLGVRLTRLEKLLDDRLMYSMLMQDIRDRTPPLITLGGITLSNTNPLVLEGRALSDSYTPIAVFKEQLSESDFLSDAKVLSAGGDSEKKSFSISVKTNLDKLREGSVNSLDNNVVESTAESK